MRFLSAAIPILVAMAVPSFAHAQSAPDIRTVTEDGSVTTVIAPYTSSSALIGSVAVHDLGHDGTPEFLVGAGEDQDPSVTVLRQDGSVIGSFLAYGVGYRGGVNVAVCDVDGDGETEIVTGAAWNGGPHVRIFSNMGTPKYQGFFAFDQSFSGGINIACGDVTGDGVDDIIVGASLGGGPHIKVFSPTGNLVVETFLGASSENTGVAIAVDDANHDGVDEIYASTMGNAIPSITAFVVNATSNLIATHTWTATTSTPVRIAPIGVNERGIPMYATQGYTAPTIASIDGKEFLAPFSADATHAIFAVPFTTADGKHAFLAANTAPKMNDDMSAKSIRIDKSQQRLTAYEYGIPMHTFLISTAKPGYTTPLGKTTVRAKLLYHDYKWFYGVNDPRNYNLPNVKWNLRIYDHIYIHWAWWHNKFGQPVSHGCVNANAQNAEWIFNWSDVGTPVNIVE